MNGQFLASVILIFAGLCLLAVSAWLLTKGKRRKPGYAFLVTGVLLACVSIVLILTIDPSNPGNSKVQAYDGPTGAIRQVTVDQADPLRNVDGQKLLHKEIKDAAVANDLYKRLTELPKMPNEIVHCPLDNGVTFTFEFDDADGHHVHTAVMAATGCRQVTIDNEAARWLMGRGTDDTDAYLLQALGLTREQFTGFH